ncbi:MAG: hypothetical protein ACRDGA_08435, partial [Bacteroidota bacterium]
LLTLCSLAMARQGFAQSNVVEHAPSRWNISLGLGAGVHAAPFLVDYMNAFRQSQAGERLDDFSSMIEFFVTPEYRLEPAWSVGLEYSLLTKSQTVGGGQNSAGSEFTYNVHMPTAIVHHVIDGSSYFVKLGGGVGYHFATLRQTLYAFGVEEDFTASGVGVKLEAVGNTKFDETLYGVVGVDLRWGFLGAFKNAAGVEAFERATNTTARMQFFSLSLKFGVMFQL